MLTDTKCGNAKPAEKSYKLKEDEDLYLEVTSNCVKAWRYHFELLRGPAACSGRDQL